MRHLRLALAAGLGLASVAVLASVFLVSSAPLVIAVQAFSPLAVLGLVAALILLVLPIGGPLPRRLLLPMTALLLLAVAAGCGRLLPRWASEEAPSGPILRVMTANVRLGEADAADLLDVVRKEHPDLLVVEEITPDLRDALEAAGLRHVLPYAVGRAEPGATGTMAFATTPLTSVRALPTAHLSWSFELRGLRVWGVHPAYPYSPRWLDDQHRLARSAAAERPDIVLGDLNASLDNPTVRDLLATGLASAAEQAGSGWQPTWPVGGFGGIPRPVAAIDHVLVGEDAVAVATRVYDIDSSDHRALVADLVLR